MLGVLIAALLMIALLGLSRWWQVRANLEPETARKVMHIGTGVIALSFPWLLRENWAVLTVCGLAISVLLGLRHIKLLKKNVGDVLHSVERSSGGDLYFLLAVAALFVLSHGNWILYFVPLLVLTFADGFAALAGVNYGKWRYIAADGQKTVEGSLAFAVVAFLCTLLPLQLFTATGQPEALVIALLVALLVMLLEAIAWEGLDNLFVPLGTLVVLDGHLYAPLNVQLQHLAALFALTLLVYALRKRMPLTTGALVAAAFVLYLCATLGGWRWTVAPLTVGAAGLLIWQSIIPALKRRAALTAQEYAGYGVQVVLSLAAPSLVWLLTSVYWVRPDFGAFALAWAAQLAGLQAFTRRVEAGGSAHLQTSPSEIGQAVLISLLVLVPHAVLNGGHALDWLRALHGLLSITVGLLACALLAGQHRLSFQIQVTLMGLVSLSALLLG